MSSAILPGSTIGVLGSGQLGRMFAIAARRMGYRVHTLSPDQDTPTGQVADLEVKADYEDLDAIKAFAEGVSVITFEFENVPGIAAEKAAEVCPVRPNGNVLHVTQHRLREKTFLAKAGLPVTPFRRVDSLESLHAAAGQLGLPGILKSAGFGYDGKGQARVESADELEKAWKEIGGGEAVLEKLIQFECELSVVAARSTEGAFVHYGLVRNEHRDHILDISTAPALVDAAIAKEAIEIARSVLETLDVVGVLCVEFFLGRDGKLLINELAPRPHNSGHFTFDANVTSQFEQQLRAVCGLPLGDVTQLRPAGMANLLGDIWSTGEPDWQGAAAISNVKLHFYGKLEPRPKRKMGHLTALAETVDRARIDVERARRVLARE